VAGVLVLVAFAIAFVLLNRGREPDADALLRDGADRSNRFPLPSPAATVGATAPSTSAGEPEAQPEDEDAGAATHRFVVAVSPLVLSTNDERAAFAFRSVHSGFLGSLRSIQNLGVIELDSSADAEPLPDEIDFHVETLAVSIEGEPGSAFHVSWSATRGGSGNWRAPIPVPVPPDPAALARDAVTALRRYPFPPERTRPAELGSLAIDTTLPMEERLDAIEELRGIPERFEFIGRDEQRIVSVAAADIVLNAADPEIRGRVWRAMADAEDPYLIGFMVDSLLNDRSDFVRVEATRSLSKSFRENARVAAALEYAYVNDLSPQVRVNARWGSVDEAGRKEYIATTLLNRDLTDAERIELINARVNELRRYVDRPEAQALVDIARRARPSSEEAPAEGSGQVRAADVVPLLLEMLTEDPREEIRVAAASALLRHRDEDGVREVLRRVQNDDPSEAVRRQFRFVFLQ